jgi:imidazolonepropionase-like amidohydrolase
MRFGNGPERLGALTSAALAVAFVAAPSAAQTPASASTPRAFVGATLIDGTGQAPVRDAVIVVRDGRITCIGARTACATDGLEVVQLGGRWIVPGLVDAHVHYSQTGWADGRPDALDMRARFPYAETIARLRDPASFYRANLCSGVTATFDVGGYPWTWGLRAAAEVSTAAPHVSAAGPLLSTRDHWVNVPAERQFIYIGSDSATAEGAHYLIANGTDAIKVWFLAGANSPDTAAWSYRLQMAGDAAKESGIPLIVHATGLWQAKQAARAGAHLLVHGVGDAEVDDEFLTLARAAGTIYTPTLIVSDGYRQLRARRFAAEKYDLACVDPATRAKAFLGDSLPGRPDSVALDRAKASARRQDSLAAYNLMRVHRAGIPIAMGTDAGNPLTLHGPSVFLEMEAMRAAGMTSMEVIVASTRNGARAMRRDTDFGTLERGKIADFVIVTADPLAEIGNLRRVERVVRNGAVWRRDQLVFPQNAR